MTRAEDRAREAIGARFRLGGRNPRFGLDCVGLVAWALEADAPDGYALRGGVPERVTALLDARLTRVDAVAPGDVLLFAAGPGQLHLGVASERGVIHADAGLRRVVERPGVMPWPVLGVWRGRSGDQQHAGGMLQPRSRLAEQAVAAGGNNGGPPPSVTPA